MFPPIEELQVLRGAPTAIATTSVGAGTTTKLDISTSLNQMEIMLNISADFTKPGVQAGISVMGGVNITLGSLPTPNAEGVNMLQLNCGGKIGQSVIGPSSSSVSLRVFLDKSSIEAYAAGGRGVASHRVYPTTEQLQTGLQLVNTGTVSVSIAGTAWPMAEAKRPSVEELLK